MDKAIVIEFFDALAKVTVNEVLFIMIRWTDDALILTDRTDSPSADRLRRAMYEMQKQSGWAWKY